MPKITYDEINDRFLIAWVESRTTRKTSLFQPFPPNAAVGWIFGDSQFVGYAAINGNDTSLYQTAPTIIYRDGNTRARLIIRNTSAMEVVSEYEFFDNVSNVDISCDSTTPECLFVWEGLRGKFVRTDKCENNPAADTDKICDEDDIVSSTATNEYSPTNKEIFGIFEKNIPLGVHSLRISNFGIGAFYPSIGFDPITKRFLTAWEDRKDGLNTKIYGQLIYSGSGLYNNNFIISFQDTNGDGQQDPNVASSRQTQPFVSYDAVNQRYFVAWQDGRNSTLSIENLDIYGQKVDAEGSLRGNNFAIYNLPFNQFSPVIANNPRMDEFLAVWKDARNTENKTCGASQPCGSDVFGQLFTLSQPAITLLNPDNTHLAPALLKNFQNPIGSGSVEVGLSATQSFKIKNTGDTILKIDFIDQTCNGGMSPFSFENLPSELNASGGATLDLVPSAELTIIVRFSPTAAGSFNKCFVIQSNGGRQTVNLSALAGIGRALGQQKINVSPSAIDFGIINTGELKSETVTIKNVGESPLTIRSVSRPKRPFSIVGNSCSNQTLSSGETCEVTISFNAKFRGRFSSSLTIRSNDPTRPRIGIKVRGAARF